VTSIGNWQCAPNCSARSQNSSTMANSSPAVRQSTSLTSLLRSGSGVFAPLPFSTPELTLSLSACWRRWARCLATLALTRSVAWMLVLRRCAASCFVVKDQWLNCVDVRYRSSSESFMLWGNASCTGGAVSGVLELLELLKWKSRWAPDWQVQPSYGCARWRRLVYSFTASLTSPTPYCLF
jgi:hypothetical protein